MAKSIAEIKSEIENADQNLIEEIVNNYRDDTRNGVKKLVEKYDKEKQKIKSEIDRIENMKIYERKYDNYEYIGGIDEVGRGPLAGPVVAAVVILPREASILYVNDSKKLSEKKREELYDIILNEAISYGIGIVYPKVIDEVNILQATYEAMRIAISKLSVKPQVILNDAVTIPGVDKSIIQVPIIKGDAKSQTIAAASIIAKVTRDRMMVEYDKIYPEYDFASNKGYGSAKHISALKQNGPTAIHRSSFIGNFVDI